MSIFLLVVSCAGYTRHYTEIKHQLLVSMHELPPFVITVDGQVQSGFIVDIFRAMASKLGQPDKIELTTFVRGFKRLQAGLPSQYSPNGVLHRHRAHLIMVRTPQRESLFKWVGPILYDGTVIYQRTEDSRVFNNLDDLKVHNALCTIQKRVSETEIFKRQDLPYYPTNSQMQAVKLVVQPNSRFDCTPIALMNTQELFADIQGSSARLKPMAFQFPAQAIYMAFSLSTPDSLIQQWQFALDSLNLTGERLALISKYVTAYDAALEAKLKANAKW